MTASTKPKTPSMTMSVKPGVDETLIQSFCKRASRLTLSQVVDKVSVNENLASTRRRHFAIDISFYPKEEYREEYDVGSTEILSAFSIKFPQILKREIQLELKKLQADMKSHLTEIGHGRTEGQAGAADEDDEEGNVEVRVVDDNASEMGDGDADDEKRGRQSKQLATYESDDDEEAPPGEFDDAAIEAELEDSEDGVNGTSDAMDGDVSSNRNERAQADEVAEVRKNFFANIKSATSFNFSGAGVIFELEVCCFVLCVRKTIKTDVVIVRCRHAQVTSGWYCRESLPKNDCS